MEYQRLKSIIQATAETLLTERGGSGLFHYGREPQHAIEVGGLPMPQIWLDPLQDTTNYSTNATNIPIAIGFFAQDTASTNAEQQAALVFAMKALSVQFMLRLSEQDAFEEITARTVPIYRHTQAMLTGVVVTFTLNTTAALCF